MNSNIHLRKTICSFIFFFTLFLSNTQAQSVLFDFDNAPLHTSLPITLTSGNVSATFYGTANSFSIQEANVLGFTPAGFSGNIIYPNSVFRADLLIVFNQLITDFSILYSTQELGCDDAATMRVTGYVNGTVVVTNTRTATFPGTWPVDTLSCSSVQGFDSVVVHYDSTPPTCQDYGVIFMADQMQVTTLSTALSSMAISNRITVYPNPVDRFSVLTIRYPEKTKMTIDLIYMNGQLLKSIVKQNPADNNFTIPDLLTNVLPGCYILRVITEKEILTTKLLYQ